MAAITPDTVFVTERVNGVEVQRIYKPPVFPKREYRIEHKTTGQWVIETPGGKDAMTQKAKPYSLLLPGDKHHATKYTDEEAVEKARAWKLPKDFAIHAR